MATVLDLLFQAITLGIRRMIQRVLMLGIGIALLLVAPALVPDLGNSGLSDLSTTTVLGLEAFLVPIIIAIVVVAELAKRAKSQTKAAVPAQVLQAAWHQLRQRVHASPPASVSTAPPPRDTGAAPRPAEVIPTTLSAAQKEAVSLPTDSAQVPAKTTQASDVDAIIARTFGPNAQRFHKRAGVS